MLNVPLLEKVATWLEAGAPHTSELHNAKFDMQVQIAIDQTNIPEDQVDANNWCGTSCCIAGAAVLFDKEDEYVLKLERDPAVKGYGRHFDVWDTAVNLIGLSKKDAHMLFAPFDSDEFFEENGEEYIPSPGAITPSMAAKTIRRFIATGEVVWEPEE